MPLKNIITVVKRSKESTDVEARRYKAYADNRVVIPNGICNCSGRDEDCAGCECENRIGFGYSRNAALIDLVEKLRCDDQDNLEVCTPAYARGIYH